MSNIDWDSLVNEMPGVVLEDQYPRGAGMAFSIEAGTERAWILHCWSDRAGELHRGQTQPLPAYGLYQALESYKDQMGEVPELSDAEMFRLRLPRKHEVFERSMSNRLPGIWIGASDSGVSEMGWSLNYSVEPKANGTYTLYSCSSMEDDEFSGEPEIETYGPFHLSDLLDELKALGFDSMQYAFLFEVEAKTEDDIRTILPGVCAYGLGQHRELLSICPSGKDEWKVFIAVPKSEIRYEISEYEGLDAKQVHKLFFDTFGRAVTDETLEQSKLPDMEEVFGETVKNKLKGFWIGSVNGLDDGGRLQKRFVSMKKDGERTWMLEWVRAEELLATDKGSRKFPLHKDERIVPEGMLKRLQHLEPELDTIELILAMSECKYPEVQKLGAALQEQLESLD